MVGTELEWSPREWSAELGKNLSRTRTEDVAQWVKCLPSVLERLELILSLEMWCLDSRYKAKLMSECLRPAWSTQ